MNERDLTQPVEGIDPGPTGRECYGIVAEELDVKPEDRADALADLDPKIVERARTYAARSHKRWPPRPSESGWRVQGWS